MKPSRPFGLTLAILTAWMLFTVIPMVVTLLIFSINSYIYRDDSGGMSGTAISNFQTAPYAGVMAASILMAFVGIFTWTGRPRQMRVIFPATVALYTLITVLGVVLPIITSTPTLQQGLDSSRTVIEQVLSGFSGLSLICTAYCLWFCNRWSARAFFRGYYTEHDKRALETADLYRPVAETL